MRFNIGIISMFLILFVSIVPVFAVIMDVCLDPGHGGIDGGAPGRNGDEKPNEADFNLEIAQFAWDYLIYACGRDVIMTRYDDIFVHLSDRKKIACGQIPNHAGEQFRCYSLVSIHCNSNVNENAHGTETFYSYFHQEDLAQSVHSHLWNYLQMFPAALNRGCNLENFYLTTEFLGPACLTEVAFVSHPIQWNQLLYNQGGFKDYAAIGISEGIHDVIGPPCPPMELRMPFSGGNHVENLRDVSLIWDPSETPGVLYNIYRQDVPSAPFNLIEANWDGTSYTDETVEQNHTYAYIVRAILGAAESLPTNIIYVQTPPFFSDTHEATFPNNGKKIICDVDGITHLVFENDEKIWYTISSNFGQTWFPSEAIGTGTTPIISLDNNNNPHVLWIGDIVTPDTSWGQPIRYGLFYGWLDNDYWLRTSIFDTTLFLSPPSFSIGTDDSARVVFNMLCEEENTNTLVYGSFYIQTIPEALNDTTFIDQYAREGLASLAIRNSDNSIHVAYEKVGRIYYVQRNSSGVWGSIQDIFSGSHPCIDVKNDSIAIIWEKPLIFGPTPGHDIKAIQERNKIRVIYGDGVSWSGIETISQPRYSICYPVLLNFSLASWQEYGYGGKLDIWRSEKTTGWSTPENVSYTSKHSRYPHLAIYPPTSPTEILTLWTEGTYFDFEIQTKHEVLSFSSSSVGDEPHIPILVYSLKTASPNPFLNNTTIFYSIANPGYVSLNIYDISGRITKSIVHGKKDAGFYSERWDGSNNSHQKVAAGVYFTRLESGDFTSVKKVTLVR